MLTKEVIIDGKLVELYFHKRGWSLDPVSADEDNDRLDAVIAAFKASWHNKSHTADPMEATVGIDTDGRFGCS